MSNVAAKLQDVFGIMADVPTRTRTSTALHWIASFKGSSRSIVTSSWSEPRSRERRAFGGSTCPTRRASRSSAAHR